MHRALVHLFYKRPAYPSLVGGYVNTADLIILVQGYVKAFVAVVMWLAV